MRRDTRPPSRVEAAHASIRPETKAERCCAAPRAASAAASKAQRNAAIQKRRDARLKTINTPYVAPSVDARERVGRRGVYLRHSTFEADGACRRPLEKLIRRWSAHSLVKAVVIEGVQGAFRTGDRASLYRAAAACDADRAARRRAPPPGRRRAWGRGFRVCGDGAVFVPPLGAAAVAAGVTLDGGAAFACSKNGQLRAGSSAGVGPARAWHGPQGLRPGAHVVTDHALYKTCAEELADVADQASDAAAAASRSRRIWMIASRRAARC